MPRKPSPARLLTRLLDDATTPVYVVDDQRRLVWGNEAFASWTGRSVQDLVGLKLSLTTSGQLTGAAELAAALCPPLEAFRGEATSGVVAAPNAAGEMIGRQAQFALLAGEGGSSGLCVFVGSPAPAHTDASAVPSPADLHHQLLALRGQFGRRYHIGQLIGMTPQMRRVRQQVRIAAQSRANVLVIGPPGSGREHVLRTIHYAMQGSGGTAGPLVPLDCSLLDAELTQSAVTSLLRRRDEWKGMDRPGALLLLEVDRLSASAQQELAGFLKLPGIELSVMATSSRPLGSLVKKRKLHSELAYALGTLVIALPPLCKRLADLPLLAQFFLEEVNADGGKQLSGFTSEALDRLAAHDWPRNVEELEQVVRQSHANASGPQVQLADLPPLLHHVAGARLHPATSPQPIQLDDFLQQIEVELLKRALAQARGNKSKAARLLGIHRARLIRRLVQVGLAAAPAAGEPILFEEIPDVGQAPGSDVSSP